MRYSISNTAEYGDLTRGPRVINSEVKKEMRKILDEIQTGKFVRDWILECKSGQLNFKAEKRIQNEKKIEIVGEKLRSMMPWITSNKLVNKNKN
jgi:ketol-acid reductoisomerase